MKCENLLIHAIKCKDTVERGKKVLEDTDAFHPLWAQNFLFALYFVAVVCPTLQKHQRSYYAGKVQSGATTIFLMIKNTGT